MSTDAALTYGPLLPLEQLRQARAVVQHEADALARLASNLPADEFCRAVELLYQTRGSVIVSGMGKAGLIGQKIAATLASTGARSHFLHPAEALHGDLGRIGSDDCVLALSYRGETEELLRMLSAIAAEGVPLLAITGHPQSTLARRATVTLPLGPLTEADHLGLAPTTSTTLMLALGDALAIVLCRMRGFRAEDFARFHPGGSLGRKLARVEEVMRPLEQCRLASDERTVREVLVQLSRPGRRTGAIMLVDARGALTGLFTDSDLARLFEHKRDAAIDGPVRAVMTQGPTTIHRGALLTEAVALLSHRKFSELPVIDEQGRPVGLLDITDLLGFLPPVEQAEDSEQPPQTERSTGPARPGRFPFRTIS